MAICPMAIKIFHFNLTMDVKLEDQKTIRIVLLGTIKIWTKWCTDQKTLGLLFLEPSLEHGRKELKQWTDHQNCCRSIFCQSIDQAVKLWIQPW